MILATNYTLPARVCTTAVRELTAPCALRAVWSKGPAVRKPWPASGPHCGVNKKNNANVLDCQCSSTPHIDVLNNYFYCSLDLLTGIEFLLRYNTMLKCALFPCLKVVVRLTISLHFLALGSKSLLIPASPFWSCSGVVRRAARDAARPCPVQHGRALPGVGVLRLRRRLRAGGDQRGRVQRQWTVDGAGRLLGRRLLQLPLLADDGTLATAAAAAAQLGVQPCLYLDRLLLPIPGAYWNVTRNGCAPIVHSRAFFVVFLR